ncbi:MAG: cobyrinate a,c-diamide synthase [Ruminococcus sp.]|jgi:cobyrinic acid a,c-diamide synthase
MKLPRILIAAPASGSGKTLITCGILQLLKNRGKTVTSFKCGPDYIDPMFHTRVIGTRSRNLDPFFTDPQTLRGLMQKNGRGSDLAVVEGVMGYYDGLAGISSRASAWDVADITDTPSVLLVNCKGMSVSVIPFIKGFLEYKENSHIKGVIFNRLSPMMYQRMKEMVEKALPVRVYGYVPAVGNCHLESRHLGLVMPDEIRDLQENLNRLAKILEESLDVEGLLQLADSASPLNDDLPAAVSMGETLRIGLARDEAFCFFYEDNLDLLREMGVSLVPFSPIHDRRLPEELDGLLLHGGYPELYAKDLSKNTSMRDSVKRELEEGLPCIAECGGFMYLHEQMQSQDGEYYKMAGVIPGTVHRKERLTRFGYITLSEGKAFGCEVGNIPSHEFHYYDSENCGEDFLAVKPLSKRSWRCIHSSDTLFAGYPHLYYYGNRRLPRAFLERCRERKGKK